MHRILCIHGIGKHGNDWVTVWFTDAIDKAAERVSFSPWTWQIFSGASKQV